MSANQPIGMTEKSRGIFISFEGTDGSGKSTLIREVSRLLNEKCYAVIQTREPGGSQVAEKIREIIVNLPMDPRTELLLYESARAEHLGQVVLPALARREIVLCDRFTDSTLAYQAHARGLSWKEVSGLNKLATSGLKPDLTVFIDIDPERALKRAVDPNRFEAEGLAFQKKVRAGYLKARAEDPKRWFTLKVKDQSPQELAHAFMKEFLKKFKTRLVKIKQTGSHG